MKSNINIITILSVSTCIIIFFFTKDITALAISLIPLAFYFLLRDKNINHAAIKKFEMEI